MKRVVVFALLLLTWSTLGWAQAAPSTASNGSWKDLGSLGAGSIGYAVSAKGEVVTGISATQGGIGGAYDRGFRWTAAGGLQDIDLVPGDGVTVRPYGISADANTIVGWYAHYPECNPNCAFSWEGGVFDILGPVPGGWYGPTATGVSKDGSVVVGWTQQLYGGPNHSFRWTSGGGFVDIGPLPGGTASQAFAVSADGTVIVGASTAADGNTHAYRWSKGSFTDLGFFNGGNYSEARGASTNGSVVVGSASTQGAYYPLAFRWTKASGKVSLGLLPGKWYAIANGVSADGKTVVGYAAQNCCDWVAFRWTHATGMQSLNDWLEAVGVDASNVSFYSAYGVSANGNGVVGQLTNGNAYLALVKANKTGTPTSSPKPGIYQGSVTVTLNHTSQAASMYYTTDGTVPTKNSPPYVGPIQVTVSTTIKAIAIVPGYPQSAVATGKYTIK